MGGGTWLAVGTHSGAWRVLEGPGPPDGMGPARSLRPLLLPARARQVGTAGGHHVWQTHPHAPWPRTQALAGGRTDRWTDKWEAPSPEGGRHREVSCGWFQGLISVWGHLLCPPVPLGRSGGVRTGGAEGSRPIFLLLAEQVGGGPLRGFVLGAGSVLASGFPHLVVLVFERKYRRH